MKKYRFVQSKCGSYYTEIYENRAGLEKWWFVDDSLSYEYEKAYLLFDLICKDNSANKVLEIREV